MILIVEDQKDVNALLCKTLQQAGYETDSSYTGLNAMDKLSNHQYELVLLDLMLPYKSGDEILKWIRQSSNIPVIIISAKDLVGIKIDLLKLGADDYITKPFDLGEVVARVESNLRRYHAMSTENKTIQYKMLEVDTVAKRVYIEQEEITLTSKEYLILELLLCNPKKVFTKANIYETVWQDEYMGDDNAVKTHISNLRTKLKKVVPQEEYIETVWGLGYRMCQ